MSNPARTVDGSGDPRVRRWRRRRTLNVGCLVTLEVAILGLAVVPGVLTYNQTHPSRVPLSDSPASHGLAFSRVLPQRPAEQLWYLRCAST